MLTLLIKKLKKYPNYNKLDARYWIQLVILNKRLN